MHPRLFALNINELSVVYLRGIYPSLSFLSLPDPRLSFSLFLADGGDDGFYIQKVTHALTKAAAAERFRKNTRVEENRDAV